MHLLDGRPVLSASDLVGFIACEHLTQLELAATRGELTRPERDDPELDVLVRKGDEHERRHLARLRADGRRVAVIDAPDGTSAAALLAAEAETAVAMASGVDVVFQAAFFDGRWRGQADFLYRVDRPSDLGPWSYEPVDTKLAGRVKASAILQLCSYAEHVTRLQGRAPDHVHVVTGDRRSHRYRLADFAAYHRAARTRLEEAALGPPRVTYPDPVEHCGVCRWAEPCLARRRADDHLSLVAGMRRDQVHRLAAAGVGTVAALGETGPGEPTVRIGRATLDRLRLQAALQLRQRRTGTTHHEPVEPVEAGRGLCLLPPPSPGDLFFDIEGDPFVGDDGLEYLFGVVEQTDEGGAGGATSRFLPHWGHDPAGERRAFEAFVDLVIERLDRDPDLHVYHYGAYEPSVLKRLMGRHASREDEVDRLLRGGVLVDLYKVVRQGVRVSEESYSLKRIEHLYLAARNGAVADGASSIVAYEGWLETGDARVLDDIAAYNRLDCESTWRLREWLEERRAEAERRVHGPLPRPSPADGAPSAALAEAGAEVAALVARLTADVPDDPALRTDDQAARWLLAQLVDWHRREARPEWWAWFHRLALTDEELLDDTEAISGLVAEGRVAQVARSFVHRYRFPPAQEHKMPLGQQAVDPATGKGCGEVVALDPVAGVVDLKRSVTSVGPHPTAVVPGPPVNPAPLRRSLQAVATMVADHGLSPRGVVTDLLLRRPPRLRGEPRGAALQRPGEDGLAAAVRLATRLDGTTLAVQGPPGSGKTHTGARMILALVAAGARVGVTAASHKAIGNLLKAVADAAAEAGTTARMAQKAGEAEWCGVAGVDRLDGNAAVVERLAADAVDVVAGTCWLFSAADMAGRLDVLVVDEAGQFSLANAVAVSSAATNLVLLGDPRQLAQPSKGTHPPGADASALEHLLGGHATVPPDLGLFLSTTRRMHPDLCAVVSGAFYDGRLVAHPSCAAQGVDAGPWAGGTGLRWMPVVHQDNRATSPEEVAEVARGVEALVGRPWTDHLGRRRWLNLDDIVVVAPYNSHVSRLQAALPPGTRVGTVDRFQGQEAAVAVFSMATSSIRDSPRGLDFLYSLNRLNVAVSRARALAVVIACPDLLRARCRTPEQLRLVNALCRLAEVGPPAQSAPGPADARLAEAAALS